MRLPWLFAAAAAAAYMILLGGTIAGELLLPLRVANAVLGAVLVGALIVGLREDADRVDRLAVRGLVLFVGSAVFSGLPRVSLDVAIGAVAWFAAFYLGRRVLGQERPRRMLGLLLTSIALILAVIYLGGWVALAQEWLRVAGTLPPVNVIREGGLYGHAYDVTALVVMLTPAAWLIPRPPPGLRPLLVVLAAVLLIITGSRTLWVAAGFTFLAVLAARLVLLWRDRRIRVRWPAVGSAAVVLLVAALGAYATGLLDAVVGRALRGLQTVPLRFDLWSASLEVWAERPLTGLGPGTFPFVLQLTDYFTSHPVTPRHPDNALVQLFSEAGLMGVAGAALLVGLVAMALWRQRRHPVAVIGGSALLFIGVVSMATNPLDHGFIHAAVVLYAALLTARPSLPADQPPPRVPTWRRAALAVPATLVAVVVAVTAMATASYAGVSRLVEQGDAGAALAALDRAVQLDPGMPMYWRERGSLKLTLGDLGGAERDLLHASALNPSDDTALRALAIMAHQRGDLERATEFARLGIDRHGLHEDNLLLYLAVGESEAQADRLRVAATAMVRAPWVPASAGWAEMVDLPVEEVAAAALEQWQADAFLSSRPGEHLVWIAAYLGREETAALAWAAGRETPHSARSLYAALQCDLESARREIELARAREVDNGAYWHARLLISSLEGRLDEDLLQLASLRSHTARAVVAGAQPDDLLSADRSTDAWGYERGPITTLESPLEVPFPTDGFRTWLFEPDVAAERSDGLVGCPDQ